MLKILLAVTVFVVLFASRTLSAEQPESDQSLKAVTATFGGYIAHAIASHDEQARRLTDSSNSEDWPANIRQAKNFKETKVLAVYADKDDALAISSLLFFADDRGFLVLHAERQGEEWRIVDIDFRDANRSNDKVYAELGEFWYRHPNARSLRFTDSSGQDRLPDADSR